MKYLRHFATLAILGGLVFATTGMASSRSLRLGQPEATVAGIPDITLQNKCTRDVKYSVSKAGETTQGVIAKGDKVRLSLAVGTAITVDGEAFMTVSEADNGQTFQVCR